MAQAGRAREEVDTWLAGEAALVPAE